MQQELTSVTRIAPLNDVYETAETLASSPHTIRAWLKEGRLRGVRIGRRWFVENAEILRVINAGRVQ